MKTQCLSLDHKPLRSESHGHDLVTNTAREYLQMWGIPVLLWSGSSTCYSSKVGPLSPVFRREEQIHKSFQSHQGKLWQELDHENSTRCPMSSWSVSVFLQPVFFLFFSHLPPATFYQIVLYLQKTWVIDSLSDFKAKKLLRATNLCFRKSALQANQHFCSCKQIHSCGQDTTFKTSICLCVFWSSLLI